MTDATPAPAGASASPSPECAAHWPAPSEWPAEDAPAIEWARFYARRLGLRVLPTPSPQDREAHALHLFAEAEADYRHEHHNDFPEDVSAAFWDDCREFADGVRGPIPKFAGRGKQADPTDEQLERWFTVDPRRPAATAHHAERGLCCVLGVGRLGWVPAQVDVDPRHGGYILGEYATILGPRVYTPGGGIHVFVDARAAHVHHSANVLAPGVEVRVAGFALLPSGPTSPGRRWAKHDAPRPPPLALTRPPPRPATTRTAPVDDPWAEDGAGGASGGRVAAYIATPCGKGDGRTAAARAIVGMLAQARGAPEDVVSALLALLVEYGTGHDWPAPRVAEEVARWRAALTRGPRDAEFAAEVLATWFQVRNSGPGKSVKWARALARSVWKTANRRQDGTAGAEDMGHAGPVGERDAWADDPPRLARDFATPAPAPPTAAMSATTTAATPQALTGAADRAVQSLAAEVSAGDADAQRAAINEFRLRQLLPSLVEAYPRESFLRDAASTPVKVECLYPFADFLTWEDEIRDDLYEMKVGHGYGRDMSMAFGGIREGDFKACGAAGAKGGKTHFLGQMVEGLALCTAARIMGVPGYANSPIVMPVWVSEMPKEGELLLRMIGRLFGFDMAAIADGTAAAEARGIVHMAERLEYRLTPAQIVAGANHLFDKHSYSERTVAGFAGRHVVREIDLSKFPPPKGTGRHRVDFQSGPNLVGMIADATAIYRRELADLAGVSEDKVLPLVLLDPGQRFAGDAENSKAELDSLLGAVVARICRRRSGLGGACIMTSDTTKAAARDLDLERFLSEPSGQKLAADIFAGSQAIMHHCDVFAVCGDDSLGDHFRRTQWVRVLQGRTGASAECFPFSWETHTGRFRPRKAEPLRKADPERAGGWRGGGGGRGARRPPMLAPGPEVGDHGPRLPPYRQNLVRPHHEPKDD